MERKKTALSRFFDVIDGVENAVLAVMVVGMIFTILVQIIGRVIGHPFPWTEETSRYLFLWMMFVALAAGFNLSLIHICGYGKFEFIVEDNGIGMDEGFLEHVYDPFERANDERVKNIQGTGLGTVSYTHLTVRFPRDS